MSLLKTTVLQATLIRYHNTAEMKLRIIKKVIDRLHIEIFLDRSNCCPFQLCFWLYSMFFFYLTYILVYFPNLPLIAPHSAYYHNITFIMLKKTALITINIA